MKYRNYKDNAIVINSVNYGESDKILTLFGENLGKFALIAKGIRKIKSKNRGNLQTLFLSEINFVKSSKSSLGILKESSLIKMCDYKLESLDNVKKVLFILNKFLADGEEEEEVFHKTIDLLTQGFYNENINKYRIFLLRKLGFMGSFNNCAFCEDSYDKYFLKKSTFEIFCPNCYKLLNKKDTTNFIPLDRLKDNDKLLDELINNYILRILI